MDNLVSYLTSARSSKTLSINDLNRVLLCLNHKLKSQDETNSEVEPDDHSIGDHVVTYWLEGSTADFFLGVIEEIKDSKIFVSHMVRADKHGTTWVFPEVAELLETKREQIIARNVLVQYIGSVRIRCKILSKTLISEIKSMLSEII